MTAPAKLASLHVAGRISSQEMPKMGVFGVISDPNLGGPETPQIGSKNASGPQNDPIMTISDPLLGGFGRSKPHSCAETGPGPHFPGKIGVPESGTGPPPRGGPGSSPRPRTPPERDPESGSRPLGVCLGRAIATSPRLVQLNGTSHFAMLISSLPPCYGEQGFNF